MPKAYSLDLRERVARFVRGSRSCHAAAAHFSVSVSFVVRLMKAFRTTGRLAPKASGGRRHAKLDPHRAFLLARAAAQPGDEGLRHPMPKRRLAAKPLALQTTAAQTGHLRRSSGL